MAKAIASTRPSARTLTTISRRTLLQAAAVGTAAVGLAGAARAIGIETAAGVPLTTTASTVVAYVRDAARGDVVVMVGANEIVRRDARLAARLIEIAKEAGDVVAS